MEVGFNAGITNPYQNRSSFRSEKSRETDKSEKTPSAKEERAKVREDERKGILSEIKKSTSSFGVNNSDVYGKTIGQPELSDKAREYYNSLKEKFGDMEFVLCANDSIEGAEKKAAALNTGGKTIVLIDAEKIERMAEDEEYRKKYEGIIDNGKKQLDQIAEQMKDRSDIAGFGMRVGDDGKTSFFAITKKNNDEMIKKQGERRDAKRAKAKEETRKAHKKKEEEKRAKKLEDKRLEEKKQKEARFEDDDLDIVEADSIEELLEKLSGHSYGTGSDGMVAEEEAYVGGSIDLSL